MKSPANFFSILRFVIVVLCTYNVANRACSKDASTISRVNRGIQVLYDFRGEGKVIHDRSSVGKPIDLVITNPKAVTRRDGRLQVLGKAGIRCSGSASRLSAAIRASNAITIEAWIRAANDRQDGPARIITLSKNGSLRNFTVGQDGNRFDVRLRTTKTSENGIPSLASNKKTVRTKLTHIIYTRDRSGRSSLYLDGRRVANRLVAGSMSNWDSSFRLALADEHSGGRQWLGTYHLVSIYNRALSPGEVQQNYLAGADAESSNDPVEERVDPNEEMFVGVIAPLLSKHCLECHDAATREGGLDLSRKITAMQGGDSGEAIIAGKPVDSSLWTSVDSDEMPNDRPPLSPSEKSSLRSWIEGGATWSLERIDPAVYVHEGQSSGVWVQRLTIPEYIETVRSSVGVDIADEAIALLPPDKRADGFRNTSYNLNVDLGHVQAYADLAKIIVDRMDVEKFALRFHTKKRLIDDDMRALIAKMGEWLLRGPLREEEVVVYRGITTTVASAGGDFEEAAGYVIEAMLQSPRFLYRMEAQRGDGEEVLADEYELASRLSYIIWGAPPDQELMIAAKSGELFDPAVIQKQIDRLLLDDRAVDRSMQFITDWLSLDRLDHLQPDSTRFPDWDPRLASDMRNETLAFCREVIWKQRRPLGDLLNAQLTYLTPRLAKHYGMNSVQRKGKREGMQRYDLRGVPGRGGLLTHGSVLTVGGDEASMVSRGLFVLHDLLRGVVHDPPPCVDTTPIPTKPGLTQRAIAEARLADETCGGCHDRFEPLAFGLERFDGLGSYHEQDEHGNRLREDGKVLVPGESESRVFATSDELMRLLAESERVSETMTWKLTQFALGRPLGPRDAMTIEGIHRAAEKAGGTYADRLRAILISDLVLKTHTEK